MANDTPLPCPFCSGSDIRFTDHGFTQFRRSAPVKTWSMCCYKCGATFPNRSTKESLLESWNTRPPNGTSDA